MHVFFVKQNIIQLAHIDHFAASGALVEMFLLRFAQLVKVSGIHRKSVQESSIRYWPERLGSGNALE
jgi:hypothetical protein